MNNYQQQSTLFSARFLPYCFGRSFRQRPAKGGARAAATGLLLSFVLSGLSPVTPVASVAWAQPSTKDIVDTGAGMGADMDVGMDADMDVGMGADMDVGMDADTGADTGAVKAQFECHGTATVYQVCREVSTGLPARVLPRSYSNLYRSPQASTDGRISRKDLVSANIPAFVPLYVFSQQAGLSQDIERDGWYWVGTNDKQPLGWIRAQDALPWRQALVVSYTHPGEINEGRRPVLMFDRITPLQNLLNSDDTEAAASAIYQQIDQKHPPRSVVSIEPKNFIDIRNTLYFLPISNWSLEEVDGEEIHLLEISAAVPNARGADTLANDGYMRTALTSRRQSVDRGAVLVRDDSSPNSPPASVIISQYGAHHADSPPESVIISQYGAHHVAHGAPPVVDIVFVVDTTLSMQPYINRTRDAIRQIAEQIETTLPGIAKFGLVGYRDSSEQIPHIGYTAKNYTPELISSTQMVQLLGQVKATRVDSNDEAEEVFAGLNTALDSNWRQNDFRFIVLIGDASGHDRDHPYSTTYQNHEDIKDSLVEDKVHLMAIHLQSNRHAALRDRPTALAQYAYLATVAGSEYSGGSPALVEIDTTKELDFYHLIDSAVRQFLSGYYHDFTPLNNGGDNADASGSGMAGTHSINQGSADNADLSAPDIDSGSGSEDSWQSGGDSDDSDSGYSNVGGTSPPPSNAGNAGEPPLFADLDKDNPGAIAAAQLWQAALIEYIGQSAKPPKDITVWVADRDLTNLSDTALQVRVVLTKEQLSTLTQALQRVLQAVEQAKTSQQQFFTALQSVAGQTIKHPEDIASAGKLSETGLLPKFIEGLPYKSDILSLDDDMFASMTPDQRGILASQLNAKLLQYRQIIEKPDLWKLTNRDDPDSTKVYPLPLDFLP